jgi:sarcosine oxidase, subunit alpha
MSDYRITKHPVLSPLKRRTIDFFYRKIPLKAHEGEMISTALFANGIRTFGKHHKDNSAQGIFCANGQCAQCLVIADGKSVKSCVTPISRGMVVLPIDEIPNLPPEDTPIQGSLPSIDEFTTDVFIMGGGPAGLSAAIEIASKGVNVIIADDKNLLGGKLGLQTHNFFGSAKECYAGVRGMDIGTILSDKVYKFDNITVWLNSPVVGAFSDKKIGVVKDGKYVLVQAERFLVTAGAREKALAFPGCDLPGVYGAGAFQTLVNRDMVKSSDKLFVLGGGNVGLIAAYHALQAGIDVFGLAEAMSECGGYKVHLDKIKRLGVPVWTSHTVIQAIGDGKLEKIIVAKIDENFLPIPGTEAEIEIDTLLIAVGLSSVNEMLKKANEFGIKTYAAGDANVIAEASAAIFGGKIIGRKILQDMNIDVNIPPEWKNIAEILESRPGKTAELSKPNKGTGKKYPVIRCTQEIPCNPCVDICFKNCISLKGDTIMNLPAFDGECTGCGKCVAICPGLAITLIDEEYDAEKQKAKVTIPWELPENSLKIGDIKTTTGYEGEVVGKGKVLAIKQAKWQDRRKLVHLEVPFDEAKLVAGIRAREPEKKISPASKTVYSDDDIIVCRCERATKQQIVDKIKSGYRDINAIKADLRIGMGPCGGKTCLNIIRGIFYEYGIDPDKLEQHVYRPFELEVPLSAFINREDV